MTRPLHIVLPMAGRGSRFANAGFTTPKPLIEVDGQPMFLKALSSLDNIQADKQYTIIIRKEHDKQYHLASLLSRELPGVHIVITDEQPTGAAVDALRSREFLQPHEGVVVMDCDLWFQSESYNTMVVDSLNDQSDIVGGLLTFHSDEPRYSYVEVDQDGFATRTAEKVVISNNAITGAYFFASSDIFISAAEELLTHPLGQTMPEYYMSLLYNELINQGKVAVSTVDAFRSFGTPEELEQYEKESQ